MPKKEKGSSCSSLLQKAMVIDMYGRPFYFMLPNKQQKYKSIVGSLCTVFILSIVLIYAIYKLELLIAKEEARIQSNVEDFYYDSSFSVDRERGFNMAFSLQSNSGASQSESFDDETFGRLRLLYYDRELEADREVYTRPCSIANDFSTITSSTDNSGNQFQFYELANSVNGTQ